MEFVRSCRGLVSLEPSDSAGLWFAILQIITGAVLFGRISSVRLAAFLLVEELFLGRFFSSW